MLKLLAVKILEQQLLITIQRNEALIGLDTQLLNDLADQQGIAEAHSASLVVVITGSRKAISVGADTNEIAEHDLVDILNDPRPAAWQHITVLSKTFIAAINRNGLGGYELAMHAEIAAACKDA